MSEKKYQGLTPELERIVNSLQIGDGIAINFFRNVPVDKAIGYVEVIHADSLYIESEIRRDPSDKLPGRISGTPYHYKDISNIKVVDPLKLLR